MHIIYLPQHNISVVRQTHTYKAELLKHILSKLVHGLVVTTMVGEIFEICLSEMAKNALNRPPWLEKILRFTHLKWLNHDFWK